MSSTVGFTTTIPVEVLFAAGVTPCDLNNTFITDSDPLHFIARADKDGFPKSMCNWVKGLYGVVQETGMDTVITVLEGDCSNTRALAEVLTYKGVRVIPFSFPYDRDRKSLIREIEKLMDAFGVGEAELSGVEHDITDVRANLAIIDRMTWEDRSVTGQENNLWQLCSSDMEGNYGEYGRRTADFLVEAKGRRPQEGIPLGYVGVPPINSDLHQFIEDLGCHIIYNEVQRQFALPYPDKGIVDRYLLYTYPYGIFARLTDMKQEIARRKPKGIVHYVQAFCYRAVEDIILRESLGVPVLTIEGDLPRQLDTRTKLRIEAFVEMLQGREE
jgi:benzoyl-CoA reductase/2-hydroxyglutaryl-CoA dehydratase subunit BcrC/BadD/HgdB